MIVHGNIDFANASQCYVLLNSLFCKNIVFNFSYVWGIFYIERLSRSFLYFPCDCLSCFCHYKYLRLETVPTTTMNLNGRSSQLYVPSESHTAPLLIILFTAKYFSFMCRPLSFYKHRPRKNSKLYEERFLLFCFKTCCTFIKTL